MRPTVGWKSKVAEQEAAVTAGTLAPADAYAIHLWPPAFTAAVDTVLAAYERDVAALDTASDEAIWTAVETVVVGLNTADEPFGAIETGEREQLAEYVDAVLTDAGVDVAALTARRDRHRSELTRCVARLVTGRGRRRADYLTTRRPLLTSRPAIGGSPRSR
ncbi:hypothetical protein C8E87_6081 [Paractinoplanes brasiliensis]|uniref:Uncharacterized protein n=2 Tax=Paractinoplanes brasiliensis TaxID=52695 RepID=A0A4R6JZH0_9ACTN|nr:hypothetical protein C8E87_6081 [Actinoplanes brasiliensis]